MGMRSLPKSLEFHKSTQIVVLYPHDDLRWEFISLSKKVRWRYVKIVKCLDIYTPSCFTSIFTMKICAINYLLETLISIKMWSASFPSESFHSFADSWKRSVHHPPTQETITKRTSQTILGHWDRRTKHSPTSRRFHLVFWYVVIHPGREVFFFVVV